MAFREVSVNEIREVLRVWLGVAGLPAPGYRTIAAYCGLDRKTVRRYVEAAQSAGLCRDDDASAVDDELIGMVAEAVRPARPDGHGAVWEQLLGFEGEIKAWVAGEGEQRPLTITKIHTLLARQGSTVIINWKRAPAPVPLGDCVPPFAETLCVLSRRRILCAVPDAYERPAPRKSNLVSRVVD
jgi:hypothetical protein